MSDPAVEPAPPNPSPRRKRSLALPLFLVAILVVPIVGFSLYVAATLSWSYSDGERAGIVQKFSHKGWVCKTWEGELAMTTLPGVAPTIWAFTVRDEAVAARVTSTLGKKVALRYSEHRGVPSSCFGETSFFVDAVRVVE
jgi:hypothetical protein